jgi:hypothetical protein
MKLKDLKPNPKNPRIQRDDKFRKLVASILSLPDMMKLRPIVVDETNTVLGGNMRLRALEYIKKTEPEFTADYMPKGELPAEWVKVAEGWSEDQKREFEIKDNVSFGEWDFEQLANEWDEVELGDWGLDLPEFEELKDEYDEEFSLPEGDKNPFRQMAFILADEQAEYVKNAIADVKKTDIYKYMETFGNENSNGNALYLIVTQWAEQRK